MLGEAPSGGADLVHICMASASLAQHHTMPPRLKPGAAVFASCVLKGCSDGWLRSAPAPAPAVAPSCSDRGALLDGDEHCGGLWPRVSLSSVRRWACAQPA